MWTVKLTDARKNLSGLEKASISTFIEYTKTEAAFLELEWYNRRQYLAGLNKKKYIEPVMHAFPGSHKLI